ncbi:MAG: glycosyltransferase, partial [Acidimicrobiales bacterium]
MTTMYVATIGGHISELVELAERIPPDEEIWVTHDTPQTRDLLAGRRVVTVPTIGERDGLGVIKAIPQARRLLVDHEVDRVVSTGSAIALAYLPVAAALGIEAHYIESSTRVTSRSKTGELLARLP